MNIWIRIFRFIFCPNQCWECGCVNQKFVVIDSIDMGVPGGGLICEAEYRCQECDELHSSMAYSNWWPRIPDTVLGRIQFIQEELSDVWLGHPFTIVGRK